MNQIALPFEWPAAENEGDFIVTAANQLVARHLQHWALWPVMATILTGPRKSGRSLIGRIFAAKSGGRLIENAEQHDQEALFHAWNAAQSDRRPLLLIADRPPGQWNIQLPDLRSRLAATPHVAIADPDEALMGALIEKHLAARGLPVGPEIAGYLVPRIERSYIAVARIVDALDAISLRRHQRITVPVARAALSEIGVIDDSYMLL